MHFRIYLLDICAREMKNNSFYSTQFWLLCLGSLFFMASFNMIIPELPDFLSSLGGAEYKGLIISLFTLTAALSRPFSGKLTDVIGRKPIMIFGSVVLIIASFNYLVASTIIGFLVLRLFHGMSTGFSPTGQTAILSDIVPFEKRGEAMGIFGVTASLGMAGGPALGAAIASKYGLDAMFIGSGILAIITLFIFLSIKETLDKPKKLKLSMLRVSFVDIYEPNVRGSAIVMMLYTFSFGAILTLIPDFSKSLGILNKGLYFTIFFIASLLSRLVAGKISDKLGRVIVIKTGLIIITLGLILTGLADSKFMFLTGAAIYGFGSGVTSPTIFAWTIDLSNQKFRGRGISTMFLSLEIGIGVGALISGWIFSNNTENLPVIFIICASLTLIAVFYLQIYWKNKKVKPLVIE